MVGFRENDATFPGNFRAFLFPRQLVCRIHVQHAQLTWSRQPDRTFLRRVTPSPGPSRARQLVERHVIEAPGCCSPFMEVLSPDSLGTSSTCTPRVLWDYLTQSGTFSSKVRYTCPHSVPADVSIPVCFEKRPTFLTRATYPSSYLLAI